MLRTLLLIAAIGLLPALDNANVAGPDLAPVMAEDVPFAADITVRNPNDRAVRIERLDSTCTCTKREIASAFILPKSTTTLHVSVDNHDRSGPQRIGITAYLTDPDLEPIEIMCWWEVTPLIAVDGIAPQEKDTLKRPDDLAWRNVYRYVAQVRPDEPQRLRKRIRLASPADVAPPEGLRILGIEHTSAVWTFAPVLQSDGSWLITAAARTDQPLTDGERVETVSVRTNIARKPLVTLTFESWISMDVGKPRPAAPGMPPLQ